MPRKSGPKSSGKKEAQPPQAPAVEAPVLEQPVPAPAPAPVAVEAKTGSWLRRFAWVPALALIWAAFRWGFPSHLFRFYLFGAAGLALGMWSFALEPRGQDPFGLG